MNKINKNTALIDVLIKLEKCLKIDKIYYQDEVFNNILYSIKDFKNTIEYYSLNKTKQINFLNYEDVVMYYENYSNKSAYDIMLLQQLKNVIDIYILQKYSIYNDETNNFSKLIKNPKENIENYNLIKNNLVGGYFAGELSKEINGDFLKCQVPKGQKIILNNCYNQIALEIEEDSYFFVYGRKGSMSSHNCYSEQTILEYNSLFRTHCIQAFIIDENLTKDIEPKINHKSDIEDQLIIRKKYSFHNISNISVPLNWIKQKICQIEFDKKEYIVPIAIGSNNVEKELLIAKINQDKNLELLIKLFNKKEISLEESKYLIEKDFDLCHYFKNMSEELKDFVLKQKNFSDQRLLRKLNLTQSNERDILFYESNISLKYLKEIRYQPSEEMIKKYLQRNGLELQYVEHQTEELCLIAVKNKGTSLRFVKNKTLELCQEAVSNDPKAIKYVEEQFLKNISTENKVKYKRK